MKRRQFLQAMGITAAGMTILQQTLANRYVNSLHDMDDLAQVPGPTGVRAKVVVIGGGMAGQIPAVMGWGRCESNTGRTQCHLLFQYIQQYGDHR